MRKVILLSSIILSYLISFSQDKSLKDMQDQGQRNLVADTSHKTGWKKGGLFTLSLGQGSSSNWAAGAEKFSFSTDAFLNLFANYRSGKFSWNNNLDLGYAVVNTSSQGARKTNDKIDFYSKLSHDLSKVLSLSGVINYRSQFVNGYDYAYLGKYQRRTSGFMAPSYLVVAPGFDWHPTTYFSIFFSPVAARFVFVTNDPKSYYFPDGVIPVADGGGFEAPLSTLYGVNPSKKVRTEFGGFASINFSKELFKNIVYKSRLDLYSNYLSTEKFTPIGPDELLVEKVPAKPQNIDVYWTNVIVMKVNNYLNVTYNFDLIYDDDVRQFGPNKNSAGTQVRSLLAVGFAAKF